MINTLHAAGLVGQKDDYNDRIAIAVWEEEYENFSINDSSDMCEELYAQGSGFSDGASDNYNKCYTALSSCGDDEGCNAVAKKYKAALLRGYKGSFEDFKKRSASLFMAGKLGLSLVGNFLNKLTGGSDSNQEKEYVPLKKEKDNTLIYVSIIGVIAIGTTLYFTLKK